LKLKDKIALKQLEVKPFDVLLVYVKRTLEVLEKEKKRSLLSAKQATSSVVA
jgi:hypothetical protein